METQGQTEVQAARAAGEVKRAPQLVARALQAKAMLAALMEVVQLQAAVVGQALSALRETAALNRVRAVREHLIRFQVRLLLMRAAAAVEVTHQIAQTAVQVVQVVEVPAQQPTHQTAQPELQTPVAVAVVVQET